MGGTSNACTLLVRSAITKLLAAGIDLTFDAVRQDILTSVDRALKENDGLFVLNYDHPNQGVFLDVETLRKGRTVKIKSETAVHAAVLMSVTELDDAFGCVPSFDELMRFLTLTYRVDLTAEEFERMAKAAYDCRSRMLSHCLAVSSPSDCGAPTSGSSGWGDSTTTPAPVVTSSGWGSTPATDTAPPASSGGGSTPSSEPPATVSAGWGGGATAPSETTAPVSSGGEPVPAASGSSTPPSTGETTAPPASGWVADRGSTGSAPADTANYRHSTPPVANGGHGGGRPMRGTAVAQPRGGYKLKVKLGDNHTVTKESLESAFGAHGPVSDCHVPTGRHFAYVSFESREVAGTAGTALNGGNVNGTRISCHWAQPKGRGRAAAAGSDYWAVQTPGLSSVTAVTPSPVPEPKRTSQDGARKEAKLNPDTLPFSTAQEKHTKRDGSSQSAIGVLPRPPLRNEKTGSDKHASSAVPAESGVLGPARPVVPCKRSAPQLDRVLKRQRESPLNLDYAGMDTPEAGDDACRAFIRILNNFPDGSASASTRENRSPGNAAASRDGPPLDQKQNLSQGTVMSGHSSMALPSPLLPKKRKKMVKSAACPLVIPRSTTPLNVKTPPAARRVCREYADNMGKPTKVKVPAAKPTPETREENFRATVEQALNGRPPGSHTCDTSDDQKSSEIPASLKGSARRSFDRSKMPLVQLVDSDSE